MEFEVCTRSTLIVQIRFPSMRNPAVGLSVYMGQTRLGVFLQDSVSDGARVHIEYLIRDPLCHASHDQCAHEIL